nr:ATP-binding cassette domain-containing protein [Flavimaricola marinus]
MEPASDPFSPKAKSRADLAATYAGLLGVDVSRGDLLERMAISGGDNVTPEIIAEALTDAGLMTRITKTPRLRASLWPALAEMTSGQVVLVLDQSDAGLTIYDTTCPANRAEVPMDEFMSVYAGTVLRADVGVAELNRRHAEKGKAPHWFWGEMAKFRRHIAEVAMGSFVANLLAVAVALFSLQVYDRVIPHQSVATLWVLAVGAGLAMLLEAFLRIARARLMDGAGRRIEMQVQTLLMDRILGMRAGRKENTPSGTFAAVREFSSIREFFTASTIGTLTDLPFIVLFLALVASIGGNVVWVLFIGGILMVLPSFFLQKKMIELTRATQGASTKSSRLLHEAIYEADTIKAHRGEDRFRRVWGELSALSSLATSEQRKLASTLTFWSQGVQQATYVSAVVTGTFMVFTGEFTVGTIIAVGILTSRTLGPLTQLASTLARWSNVQAALEALDRVAMSEQDEAEGRTYLRREKLRGSFEFQDLVYCYDEDGARSVDIAGLAIEPGQRVAILGANGSGKSTLLKLLSGIYQPTAGRIMIDGVDMGQVMPRDLRRSIGYLSQEVRLFAGTLRDNLNLTLLERDDDRLLRALDFAGLGPFVRAHPKGLDLEIRDGGEGLSVGQRQSIGWARLWLQDPAICLLDEPTAALDQALESTLVSRLDAWLRGRTAIIATHRLPILQLTDRTLVLQNGRMVVDGPRDEVLAHLNKKKATS